MDLINFRDEVYEILDDLESAYNDLVNVMDEFEMSGVYEDKCTIQDLVEEYDPFSEFMRVRQQLYDVSLSLNRIQVSEDFINYEELYETVIATE